MSVSWLVIQGWRHENSSTEPLGVLKDHRPPETPTPAQPSTTHDHPAGTTLNHPAPGSLRVRVRVRAAPAGRGPHRGPALEHLLHIGGQVAQRRQVLWPPTVRAQSQWQWCRDWSTGTRCPVPQVAARTVAADPPYLWSSLHCHRLGDIARGLGVRRLGQSFLGAAGLFKLVCCPCLVCGTTRREQVRIHVPHHQARHAQGTQRGRGSSCCHCCMPPPPTQQMGTCLPSR